MRVLKIKQALRTNASKIGAQNRQGAEWVHRPRGGCFAVEAPILSPHLPGLLFLAFGGMWRRGRPSGKLGPVPRGGVAERRSLNALRFRGLGCRWMLPELGEAA